MTRRGTYRSRFLGMAALLAVVAVSACSRADSTAGVENLWRDEGFRVIEGVTTEAELLSALGPPSQLIDLGNETVYYYLSEAFRSDRLLLILYNRTNRTTTYDRAIFFFGSDGVLTKAAFSKTSLPRP